VGRGLHADERGISPVLGTAILLAIAVTALSIFLAVWVPGEVNRREEEHMRGVEESFRKLRATIDDLRVGENGSVDVKMGPDPLPLLPNPRTGGTLSVTPAEIRGESRRLLRIPGENKVYIFWFEVLPGELEEYDWYIIARTSENSEERIESVFFYVNRDASDVHDYHYTSASQGLENTFPQKHGGIENDSLPSPIHEGWNFINAKVAAGPENAWVEVFVVIFPACTPWENVNIGNIKSGLGDVRFDWGDRSLVYESGMVILVQDNMSFMKSPPGGLIVRQENENNFEVYFNTFRIRELGGSISATGILTITVSTVRESTKPPEEKNSVTISINTKYRDAWWEYLMRENEELKAMGITADLKEENLLTLTIMGGGKTIRFYQKVTDIKVNLG